MTPEEFFARLDKANNEPEVRQRIAAGDYSAHHKSLALEWLRRREELRSAQAEAERNSREERSVEISEQALAIAKEANSIARSQAVAAWRAARYAMYAAVITTTALVVTNIEAIVSGVSQFIR